MFVETVQREEGEMDNKMIIVGGRGRSIIKNRKKIKTIHESYLDHFVFHMVVPN